MRYKKGDLIFSRWYLPYPWRAQHVAIVVDGEHVVHAVPFSGVVKTKIKGLSWHWSFLFLGGIGEVYRVYGSSVEPLDRDVIAAYAIGQLGDRYQWSGDKRREDRWYCEQLVWRAILEGARVDVDSDCHLGPEIVSSDDIKGSRHTVKVD